MKIQTFIYALVCPTSGQIRYIGKSDTPRKRLNSHMVSKERSHRNNWINNLKYNGLKPEMIIIDSVPMQEWKFWEQHYISLFKSWGFDLVNGTLGGDGLTGYVCSEVTKARLRITNKRPQTEETKEKISKTMKGRMPTNIQHLKTLAIGRILSEETRRKISISRKGIRPNRVYKPNSYE